LVANPVADFTAGRKNHPQNPARKRLEAAQQRMNEAKKKLDEAQRQGAVDGIGVAFEYGLTRATFRVTDA